MSEPDHRSAYLARSRLVRGGLRRFDPGRAAICPCSSIRTRVTSELISRPGLRMPKPPIHQPRPVPGCLSVGLPQTAQIPADQADPGDQTETMGWNHLQGNPLTARTCRFRAADPFGVRRTPKHSNPRPAICRSLHGAHASLTNATQEAPRR